MIRFGPSSLGPVKTAEKILEQYHAKGFRACEVACTYSVYIPLAAAPAIGAKARELDIELSIHAPYFVNLNSSDATKRAATKKRILDCCAVGEKLGAKVVVFHPGYYGNDVAGSYVPIRDGVVEIMEELKKQRWKIS